MIVPILVVTYDQIPHSKLFQYYLSEYEFSDFHYLLLQGCSLQPNLVYYNDKFFLIADFPGQFL